MDRPVVGIESHPPSATQAYIHPNTCDVAPTTRSNLKVPSSRGPPEEWHHVLPSSGVLMFDFLDTSAPSDDQHPLGDREFLALLERKVSGTVACANTVVVVAVLLSVDPESHMHVPHTKIRST